MVDRAARDALAQALRRLACGRITNDEFEASLLASEDTAVVGIADAAWTLYDDLYEHYLKGAHTLPLEAKRGVARCILFLRSDLDYLWPERRLSALDIARLFADLFTLGVFSRISRPKPDGAGDMSVWPFFSRFHLHAEIARATRGLQRKIQSAPATP